MKKLLAIIFLIFLAATCYADDQNKIDAPLTLTTTGTTDGGWGPSSHALGASSTLTSDAIDLNKYRPNGFFSLQYTFTGTGTLKFEYLLSNDGVTFVEPATASDIGATLAAGNGFIEFSPEMARYMKIKVSEDGTAAAATITTCVLGIQ